jgi:hypothetical protein
MNRQPNLSKAEKYSYEETPLNGLSNEELEEAMQEAGAELRAYNKGFQENLTGNALKLSTEELKKRLLERELDQIMRREIEIRREIEHSDHLIGELTSIISNDRSELLHGPLSAQQRGDVRVTRDGRPFTLLSSKHPVVKLQKYQEEEERIREEDEVARVKKDNLDGTTN